MYHPSSLSVYATEFKVVAKQMLPGDGELEALVTLKLWHLNIDSKFAQICFYVNTSLRQDDNTVPAEGIRKLPPSQQQHYPHPAHEHVPQARTLTELPK
jgi:hypothetical protein